VSRRLVTSLARLSPAALSLLFLAFAGAVVVQGWILVLRQPVATYRELVATRESLRAIAEMNTTQQAELQRASVRRKELADRLSAQLAVTASEEQLTVSLMRKLDQTAVQQGVQLTSLKPVGRREVLAFEEVSFEVGAQGKYLPLCHWLLAFEQSLGGFATVTDFTMRSNDGRQVGLSLRLALYRRPAGEGESR
jgi:Tfp pilus assembly protein PilO